MPRKRKIVTTQYVEGEEDREEYVAPPVDPAEVTYAAYVGGFSAGDDVTVKVQRETPTGKEYCFRGAHHEIDDETIRLYHAKQPYAHEVGKYTLQVYVHGELRNAFPVHIAPQVATPGTESSDSFSKRDFMLDFLTKQNERLERQLERLQDSGPREPIGALADAMLKLKTLQGEQSSTNMSLDTLMKAVELGRTLNPNGETDWKPLILDLMKDAMPAVQGLITALVAKNNPQQLNGGNMNGSIDEEAALKGVFQFLKRKCLAGSDPGLYIDVVVDNRDDPTYQKLIHAVRTRELSAFTTIDPEIAKEPYWTFFRFIYDGLRRAFKVEDSVVADTGGESRDAGDTGTNGKPSKGGGKKS